MLLVRGVFVGVGVGVGDATTGVGEGVNVGGGVFEHHSFGLQPTKTNPDVPIFNELLNLAV